MKRVSLADVARAAGVGKATASRALSGRDEVGEATRARIAEIAATMGYQPHRGAQGLRTGRFGILGIAVRVGDPDAGELLRGAAGAAARHGYQLLVEAVDLDGPILERLGAMSVDGLVVVDGTPPSLDVPAVCLAAGGTDPADRAAEAVVELVRRLGTPSL